ncbi:hypothetical protein BU17DRAFT_65675 [Hysterangium stoloniferum]|nr:hypothetical protein BU17DRAFT_65675 [Hysterangium stoloniferum]
MVNYTGEMFASGRSMNRTKGKVKVKRAGSLWRAQCRRASKVATPILGLAPPFFSGHVAFRAYILSTSIAICITGREFPAILNQLKLHHISDVRSRIEPDEDNDDIKSGEGSDAKECDYPCHNSMAPIYQMRKPFIPQYFSSELEKILIKFLNLKEAEAGWETDDDDKSMATSVTRSASESHKTSSGPSRRRAALAGENRTKLALATEEMVSEIPSHYRKQKMKAIAAGKSWPNPKKSAKSQRQSVREAQPSASYSEDGRLIETSVDEDELALQGTKRPFWCHVCGTRFVHINSLVPHYKTDDHLLKREVVGMGDVADQEYLNRQRKLRPFQCTICKIQYLEFPVLREHFDEHHKKHRVQSQGPLEKGETKTTVVTPVRPRGESPSQLQPQPQPPPEELDGEVKQSQSPQQPISPKGSRLTNNTRRNGKSNGAKRASAPIDSESESWETKQSTSKGRSSKHRSTENGGNGPYKCEPCKVSFSRVADLKRHFGTDRHCFNKTGVRARRGIVCTICTTAFTRLDAAYRHVQRSHTHEFKVYGGDIIQQADPDGDSSS